MSCIICLEARDELINVQSAEGSQLNISFVLIKHFEFCFKVLAKRQYTHIIYLKQNIEINLNYRTTS